MIVYKITNKLNNKIYIGQTIRPLIQRWTKHCCKSTNSAISLAIKKYGKQNFEIKIMSKATSIEELNYREAYYIKLFNCLSPGGYNLKTGGNNSIPSEESRKKMSESHIGLRWGKGRKPKPLKKVPGWTNPQKNKPKKQESKVRNAITHGAKPFLMKDNKGHTLWHGLIQSECAKKFNLSVGNISECLHGNRKQHKGFTFQYEVISGQ